MTVPDRAPHSEGLGALWWLARTRLRAGVRHQLRQLRRPRRAILALLIAIVLGGYLTVLLVYPEATPSRDWFGKPGFRHAIGAFLTFILTTNVWAAARNGVMAFSTAEIHFLFPAPVTTRALLLSVVLTRLVKTSATGLMFALFFRPHERGFLWAALLYGTYFAAVTLVSLVVDARFLRLDEHTRKSRSTLLGLGLAAAAAGAAALAWWQDGQVWSLESLRWIGWPCTPFVRLIFAESLAQELPWWIGVVTAMSILMLVVLTRTGDMREAADSTSRRYHKRIDQIRKGRAFSDPGRVSTSGRVLPMLPHLGGAGVHAWRQLSVLLRSRRPFYALGVFTAYMVGVMLFVRRGQLPPDGVAATIVAVAAGVGPFYVQSDFRSDFDCLAWMRTFPTPPGVLAAGQILASALVLYGAQLLLAGWIVFVTATAAGRLAWIGVFLGLPVFDLLVLSVVNGVFLVYPVRMVGKRGVAGPGQVLRLYLMMGAISVTLAVTLLVSGGVGALAGWGLSAAGVARATAVVSGCVVGFLALCVVTAICIWLVGRIFLRVDPSRDLST